MSLTIVLEEIGTDTPKPQCVHLDLFTRLGVRHFQQPSSADGHQRNEDAYGNTRSMLPGDNGRPMPPPTPTLPACKESLLDDLVPWVIRVDM